MRSILFFALVFSTSVALGATDNDIKSPCLSNEKNWMEDIDNTIDLAKLESSINQVIDIRIEAVRCRRKVPFSKSKDSEYQKFTRIIMKTFDVAQFMWSSLKI